MWRSISGIGLALALAAAPAEARESRAERSEARGALGRAYLQEGSLEAALQAFQEAVALDGGNWMAWSYMGLVLAEKHKPEDAEKALAKGIRKAEGNAEAYLNYGLFLFGQGRVDEAIAQYELALEDLTYRNPALVLNNLGFALMARGDAAGAVRVLKDAVQRAPNLCAARFNLGLALDRSGDASGAIGMFREVIELCGEQVPGAYLEAGRLLARQGQEAEATEMLLKVGELAPGTPAATEADGLLAGLGIRR